MDKEQKGENDMEVSLADLIKDENEELENEIPDESVITKEINEFISTNNNNIISDYTVVPETHSDINSYRGFSSELLKEKTEKFETLKTINLHKNRKRS